MCFGVGSPGQSASSNASKGRKEHKQLDIVQFFVKCPTQLSGLFQMLSQLLLVVIVNVSCGYDGSVHYGVYFRALWACRATERRPTHSIALSTAINAKYPSRARTDAKYKIIVVI